MTSNLIYDGNLIILRNDIHNLIGVPKDTHRTAAVGPECIFRIISLDGIRVQKIVGELHVARG